MGAQRFALVGVTLLTACAAPAPRGAASVVDLERSVDEAAAPAGDEGAPDAEPEEARGVSDDGDLTEQEAGADLPAWFTTIRRKPSPRAAPPKVPPPPPEPAPLPEPPPPVRKLVVTGALDLAPVAFQTVHVAGRTVVTNARGRFLIAIPVRGQGSVDVEVHDGPHKRRQASCRYDETTDRCEVSRFRRGSGLIDCWF